MCRSIHGKSYDTYYTTRTYEPHRTGKGDIDDHLAIKGQNLHAEKLDMEKGELQLTGTIQGMLYSDKKGKKKAAAIAKRLFR